MSLILIIYSTTDGHTLKISERLKYFIETRKHRVTLVSIQNAETADLTAFDKIVVGASIRYGKHSKAVYRFIKNNTAIIDTKANAFFSVNMVARKAEKNTPETNPYVRKFLKQIAWKPQKLAIFAGKIDYQKYTAWDRFLIRLIMRLTKGPTDPKANIEFTNWKQVENFAEIICEM